MSESPQFSVWRVAIVYGYSVPEDYKWTWERMEGWVTVGGRKGKE
jgi:crenactin